MAEGVNFLKGIKAGFLWVNLTHWLKIGSIILLIFYCLGTAATISYSLYLRRLGEKTNQELTIKKKQVADLKKIESLQMTFKQRLTSLNEISAKKPLDYSRLLSDVQIPTEPGVKIEETKINKVGLVSIKGKAVNAVILGKFLDYLVNEKTNFSEVTVSSLDRQAEGSYSFALILKAAYAD